MKNSQVTDFWGAVKRIEAKLNKARAKRDKLTAEIVESESDLAEIGKIMAEKGDAKTLLATIVARGEKKGEE